MRCHKLSVLAVFLCPCVVSALTLKPAGVTQFFVTPHQSAILRWHVQSGTLDTPIDCVVHDYWDEPVATLPARVTGDGTVEVTVEVAQGYYELRFPATQQRFGLVSVTQASGEPVPFFSIDAAMSWLVQEDDIRADLVKVLRRSGIAMSRERFNWGQVSPEPDQWDWESSRHYQTLRTAYADHGVEVLEMCHDSPAWQGRIGKYPDDLVAASHGWRRIGRRWQRTWGALEIWNEPEDFFGGNLPADQYVSMVKAITGGLAQEGIDTPIVGGVFAHCNERFLDSAASNGLLDHVDVASFHSYGRAPGMEELITRYRSWLRMHGREAMPLWITECGRPWKRRLGRPPAEQDAESALDITMKAVESRACGIARYFAFVYPFYEERDNNFGMMGRQATPLRSMAAYVRLALVLAGKSYVGDLRLDAPQVQRARVFADADEAIAVVYSGSADGTASLELDLPVDRAEGIDGRRLPTGEDGSLFVGDGLAYLWLDRKSLGGRLVTDTAAAKLWSAGHREAPTRNTASPIVLRYQFDPDAVDAKSDGYHIKSEAPDQFPVVVRVFNLTEEDHQVTLRPGFRRPAAGVPAPEAREVELPAKGHVDVCWTVDLARAFAGTGHVRMTITSTGGTPKISPLAFDLIRQVTEGKAPGR